MNNDRQARIAPPKVEPSSASPAQDSYAPTFPRVLGVIVEIIAGVIKWQRIRYKRGTPTVGEYERFGPIEDGYPLETAVASHYAVLVWGNEPVSTLTYPIYAVHRGGYWIIEIPLKGIPSVLDGTATPSGCSQG